MNDAFERWLTMQVNAGAEVVKSINQNTIPNDNQRVQMLNHREGLLDAFTSALREYRLFKASESAGRLVGGGDRKEPDKQQNKSTFPAPEKPKDGKSRGALEVAKMLSKPENACKKTKTRRR